MPVDSPNAALTFLLTKDWAMVRDVLDGESAIKAAGEAYLPKLNEQELSAFEAYKLRAVFFNATARTHEAMVGFLFRKPPTVEAAPLKDFLEDCDLQGTPFVSYCRKVAQDTCSVGRGGTLVDWGAADKQPYLAYYPAENIINWKVERIKGRLRLTMLVLMEMTTRESQDEFVPAYIEQFRVYRLVPGQTIEGSPEINDGVTVEIWERPSTPLDKDSKNPTEPRRTADPVTMSRGGAGLPDIPFCFHGAEDNTANPGRVPMADIAHVNISHYRSSADLENGRHVCGIPTPYACGFESEEKLYLGSSYAWTTENTDAKAGFIEFTGAGLESLKLALEEKQGQMAALGARLIEPRQTDAEAYETVALRASAETSTLAKIGMLCSESLTSALCWAAWWLGRDASHPDELKDKVNVVLNKDFASAAIDPAKLTAFTAAVQQGLMSKDTFFFNLEKGEVYPENWTREEEFDAIEADPPMPAPIATDPNKIDPATGQPFPKDPAAKLPGTKPPAKK